VGPKDQSSSLSAPGLGGLCGSGVRAHHRQGCGAECVAIARQCRCAIRAQGGRGRSQVALLGSIPRKSTYFFCWLLEFRRGRPLRYGQPDSVCASPRGMYRRRSCRCAIQSGGGWRRSCAIAPGRLDSLVAVDGILADIHPTGRPLRVGRSGDPSFLHRERDRPLHGLQAIDAIGKAAATIHVMDVYEVGALHLLMRARRTRPQAIRGWCLGAKGSAYSHVWVGGRLGLALLVRRPPPPAFLQNRVRCLRIARSRTLTRWPEQGWALRAQTLPKAVSFCLGASSRSSARSPGFAGQPWALADHATVCRAGTGPSSAQPCVALILGKRRKRSIA